MYTSKEPARIGDLFIFAAAGFFVLKHLGINPNF